MTSSSSATLPASAHAISGACGGALATFIFYPLEIIRVEIQAQINKTKADGTSDECEVISNGNNDHSVNKLSRTESDLECFIRLYKKQALYRGASSMVTTMLISSFITFYVLEVTRKRLSLLKQGTHNYHQRQRSVRQIQQLRNHLKFLEYILPKSKMGTSLLASTLTGIINVFLTTPLWNGTRRIMESDVSSSPITKKSPPKQPSLWRMMHHIAIDEGVLQLWHGTWSSLLLVSNPAIQYFIYEQMRVWVLGIKNDRHHRRQLAHGNRNDGHKVLQLTASEAFVFGAIAKTVATIVTYPLQLAQALIRMRKNEVKLLAAVPTEKQDERQLNLKEYNGIMDCLYQQYCHGGFSSLFTGMNAKMIQTVGQAAFTFLTYEEILKLVGKIIQS
eukprot:scaffold10268_cov61-Cyclotella_meneghiniana.AAC.8